MTHRSALSLCWTSILMMVVVVSLIAPNYDCAPPTGNQNDADTRPHPGMKKIHARGKTFYQGWNDALATSDERPGHAVTFTYDYWLDTTEVTQKRFFDLMGWCPVSGSSNYGVGDEHPVYFVSWFDAILFCNARSKAEGLDTVYIYTRPEQQSNTQSGAERLSGVKADLTRDGYRLPTEAEWEFAARGTDSIPAFSSPADSTIAGRVAWYAANSSNRTHAVATRDPGRHGLYDMAGNVFEWTNDWKGSYSGGSAVNPLGRQTPNAEYEKVIKGGAFNYGFGYLRPSNRSAIYATSWSSANEYVGFRCARGPITAGSYGTLDTAAALLNPVLIECSASALRTFTGALEGKLVFVNVSGPKRTLCCVDFGKPFLHLLEFTDDVDVYLPVISPDGRFVAYCSRNEGQNGPGTITVRSLDSLGSPRIRLPSDSAHIPRWWVDRTNGDTCLIYTTTALSNNVPAWRSGRTMVQRFARGVPLGEPQVLIENGGYHDGRSANGRYIVSGFTRLMARDLATGEEKQLFTAPQNGKSGGSDQVCNVSMAPEIDTGMRCLFLDFGTGAQPSTITGDVYGIHQYLFQTDFSGAITWYMRAPHNEEAWDYSEFSNREHFAVSGARTFSGQHRTIYAIDLRKKTTLPLVSGVELQHPGVWLAPILPNPSHFALDSIGRYNDPPINAEQAHLASKLLLFWQVCDTLDIAIIGSSLAIYGINPGVFTGARAAFNFAAPACQLPGKINLIMNYLLPNSPRLRLICSSLDPTMLNRVHESWGRGVGRSLGFVYDSTHRFWPGGATDDFKAIVRTLPLPLPALADFHGFVPLAANGWGTDPPGCLGEPSTWTSDDPCYQANLALITAIADTLRARGVHWLMVNTPMSPYYKNTPNYTCEGPSWPTARAVLADMAALDSANEFFHFYDANLDGNHDYGATDAADEFHLSGIGANKLSKRIDSVIQTFLR